MKNIQVFLKGDTTCEVDAKLVRIQYRDHGILIHTKEESESVCAYYFPNHNISMVRIFQ